MDFLKLARERYSVRKFDSRAVEKEKLDAVLDAGRCAPTAVNYQPQRVLVIESAEARAKLKKCTPYHFDAPLSLLVCYDSTVSWKRRFDGYDMGAVDASIVTTQMMLEAAELGLGSTWVGYFDPVAVRDEFALPDCLVPVAILPLGYPAPDAAPSPLHERKLAPEETIFRDSYDGIKPGSREAGAR